ncbi:MAG: CheR family methyltransferase [Bacteroidota bacterium]
MDRNNCIDFLQWALPKMSMQWKGFKKVHDQVCKRINRRIKNLQLSYYNAYQVYLELNPSEWEVLDELCRITISRFFRDRYLFKKLEEIHLPHLLYKNKFLNCWSIGCASGEEPYSLAMIMNNLLEDERKRLDYYILATDADQHLLDRAKEGRFNLSSIREVPSTLVDKYFTMNDDTFFIKNLCKERVKYDRMDIRYEKPKDKFHVVLCRYLVATYYNKKMQVRLFSEILELMENGAILVIGKHESLPPGLKKVEVIDDKRKIYRKI